MNNKLNVTMDERITGYQILNNHPKNSPFRKELEEKMKQFNIQDKEFVNILIFDVLLSLYFKKLILDVIKTDYEFSKKDKDYDAENCLFKGNSISFGEYISQKYGDNYLQFMKSLI
jgi:hypothetical protein